MSENNRIARSKSIVQQLKDGLGLIYDVILFVIVAGLLIVQAAFKATWSSRKDIRGKLVLVDESFVKSIELFI